MVKKILSFITINTILMGNISFFNNIGNKIDNNEDIVLNKADANDNNYNDNVVNFLATADIHAGYSNSSSEATIKAISNRINQNENRGVIVSGDLTGNVKNTTDISQYWFMTNPIRGHILAGFGNHDADSISGQRYLTEMVKPDAQKAANLVYYSDNDFMPVYSWNWSGVHFVQVSLAPTDIDTTRDQNNNPGIALTKLKEDLYQNVGLGANTPIVLSFHYGYDQFSLDPRDRWWNDWQMDKFKATVLKNFNVILMLTGHEHYIPSYYQPFFGVNVEGRTIYDVLSGTSLNGGYSEVSIDLINKKIKFNLHNANDNDQVTATNIFDFPEKPKSHVYTLILNKYQGEYLYAADYAPFDGDRRRVFTWRHQNEVPFQGFWEIQPMSDGNVKIYNVYQDEYLYAADYAPFDSDRRRVFTWRPGGDPDGMGTWKIGRYIGDETLSLFNVYQKEYFYAADYAPFDSDRRRVFTWRPGENIKQNEWEFELFQT